MRRGHDISGAVAVVTGAGSGIGRALAHHLADAGARVVVNDLDSDACHEVADEIGGLDLPGDAATRFGIARTLSEARRAVGPVAFYFANAGIARGGVPAVGDEGRTMEGDWAASWNVNVMAHVRAMDLLLPEWLERGAGTFVATVSAAGLLTMLGAPAYSATKHASLAFAEWASATYGDRGIAVHAICPQGVDTPMVDRDDPIAQRVLLPGMVTPDDVARATLEGIREGTFLILPQRAVKDYYQFRAQDTDGWLSAMQRIRRDAEA